VLLQILCKHVTPNMLVDILLVKVLEQAFKLGFQFGSHANHTEFTCWINMLNLHAEFTRWIYMLNLHAEFTCWIYMLKGWG
jgi:hypothetical protein